jgi:hypothetical protein
MQDRRHERYDIEALRRRIPVDRAELFLGFVPWPEDCDGWRRSVREPLAETPGRAVLRTVWDDPDDREARVLIDVVESTSPFEAIEALVDRLVWNQLARLPEGPRGLGDAAFAHPEGAPPALFFARGNLCVPVVSFGRRSVDVGPWAYRLNSRLGDRPAVDRLTLSLRADPPAPKARQEVAITYELPWKPGDDGYLKFFAEGGTLARGDGRLIFKGARPGEARIEAFLLEPGREPYGGRLVLRIE